SFLSIIYLFFVSESLSSPTTTDVHSVHELRQIFWCVQSPGHHTNDAQFQMASELSWSLTQMAPNLKCSVRQETLQVPSPLQFLLFTASFKLEIQIWLYNHNLAFCCITEEKIDKNRIYDAFISYCHTDEEYVVKILEKLETGPDPYKFCLHFRDWMPGEFISKQIVESIEKSKRTMFILTKDFMDSVWSKLEFRTAHVASLREIRPRVILILCQEFEELGVLDPEIRSYIRTNTYLKWDDKLFWERLKYALPKKNIIEEKSEDIELEGCNFQNGLDFL
uniref:TIR domain-containing protein n=1 Tax=Megaselia scalaris TaxID=36166 RepID=T1GF09_MEGSC